MTAPGVAAATALGTLYGGDAIEWLGHAARRKRRPRLCRSAVQPRARAVGRARLPCGVPRPGAAAGSPPPPASSGLTARSTSAAFPKLLADIKGVAAPHFAGCRWLVWYYRNKANLGRDWGRSHESILHLRRPDFALDVDAARVPYNAHTLRYPAHPQAESSRYGGKPYVWQPNPLGAKPRDVIEDADADQRHARKDRAPDAKAARAGATAGRRRQPRRMGSSSIPSAGRARPSSPARRSDGVGSAAKSTPPFDRSSPTA